MIYKKVVGKMGGLSAKRIVLICCMVLLAGCEKEANIKIAEVAPKLVVTSFISPQDTVVRVFVTRTVPVFRTIDPDKRPEEGIGIDNATVVLSDGNSSLSFHFNPNDRGYSARIGDFKIEAGGAYFLNVTTPDGLKAEAKCVIPYPNHTLSTKSSTTSTTDYYGQTMELLKVVSHYTDSSPEKNYFRSFVIIEFDKPLNANFPESKYYHVFSTNSYRVVRDSDISPQGVSDSLEYPLDYLYHQDRNIKAVKIHSHLMVADENYYKYHQLVESSSEPDPFSEPILPFTNINGGLGVFCGINYTVISIDVPE